MYHAFVYPYFIYCIEVWGNAKETNMDPLIKMQKRIIRVITYSHFRAATEALFIKLDILPVPKLVAHRIGLFMYKFNNNMLPKAINSQFIRNNQIHSYNTRQKAHLHTSRGVHEFIYRTFSFQATYIWNAILANKININLNYITFKHILKLFLHTNNLGQRTSK